MSRATEKRQKQEQAMRQLDDALQQVEALLATLPPLLVPGRRQKKPPSLLEVWSWGLYHDLCAGKDSETANMADEQAAYVDAFGDDPDFDSTAEALAFELGAQVDPDFGKASDPATEEEDE